MLASSANKHLDSFIRSVVYRSKPTNQPTVSSFPVSRLALPKPIVSVVFLVFAVAFVSTVNLAPISPRTRNLPLVILLPKVGIPATNFLARSHG
jgi:hypothetical protein